MTYHKFNIASLLTTELGVLIQFTIYGASCGFSAAVEVFVRTLIGARTSDVFLSEHGNDESNCGEPHAACRSLRRAMEIVDGGRAVVYVDSTPRTTSGWLCREEMVQVRGSITIKPGPPSASETARLGCGVDSYVRRVLSFNVTGRGGSSAVSLTLESLVVEGVLLLVRNGHVAVVETTLIDVSLMSNNNTDHVTIDVINSTWTSRYPNDVTTCEVGVSIDNGAQPNHINSTQP